MKRQFVCALTVLAASGAGSAAISAEGQEREPAKAVRHAIELDKAQLEGKLRAAVEMKTTTGAPYSAEATTETVQMLADGNRIARKTIVRIYRDSDGRTRREFVTADGSRVESVAIVDPVAGSSVMFDPRTRPSTAKRAGLSWLAVVRRRPWRGTRSSPARRTGKGK